MREDHLSGLQSLRALAAIMVLFGHALAEAEHYFGLSLPGDAIPWTRGVDIFFVISGFVVTLSARRFIGQPGAFFRRRVLRVVPLYFFFTTLMVAVLLIVPGVAKDTDLDPAQILSSYAFFPHERTDGRLAPVLSLGWTLNYEMFFYAVLAACLAMSRPWLAAAVCLVGLATFGLIVEPVQPQIAFWSNPLILEFLYGMSLAGLWISGWRVPSWRLAVTALLTGLIFLIVLDTVSLPRFLAAGVPATMIVAAGTLLSPARTLPGQLMGDASYALYLSHRFTLRATTLLLLPVLPATHTGAFVYITFVCVLSVAVAVLTFRVMERPLLKWLSDPARSRVPV